MGIGIEALIIALGLSASYCIMRGSGGKSGKSGKYVNERIAEAEAKRRRRMEKRLRLINKRKSHESN